MKTTLIAALGLAALVTGAAHAEGQMTHQMKQGEMSATAPAQARFELGALVIENPFSRASLPNQPVGGGFFTVTNTGTEDDRLIAASVAPEMADHMEIHEMAMDGQVMKMRELPKGLPIAAGETVQLKPGGYHLMLMGLKQPLVEGETVAVTLTFEKAGSIEVPLAIGAPNAKGGMGHGSPVGKGQMKHGG